MLTKIRVILERTKCRELLCQIQAKFLRKRDQPLRRSWECHRRVRETSFGIELLAQPEAQDPFICSTPS